MNGLQIIVGIVLYGLFFMMCYLGTGTDKKNLMYLMERLRCNEI